MLNDSQNLTLGRVGPGTPLGQALRRYWTPALLSSELPVNAGDPVRVTLLGEDFVAFRAEDGTVGILDEMCRHRSASLVLGRVEGCGIRCIYHGWKFGPDGTVLETPNVADPEFRHRFKAAAYQVREAGGLVWVYLGPPEHEPEFPHWAYFDLPEKQRIATKHYHACHFVQVIEGLVDSSHLGILHSNALGASSGSDLSYAQKVNSMQFDKAPRIEAEETDFGFRYAAHRQVDGTVETRVTSFVAPYTVVNPNGDVVTIVVPSGDTTSLFFHVFWDDERQLGAEPLRREHLRFVGLDPDSLERFGALHPDQPNAPSRANRFHQDRSSLDRSFSGIAGLVSEDIAVSVSSGPLRDRSRETLSVSDLAVGHLYRTLLRAVARVAEGEKPPGVTVDPVNDPVRGFSVRSDDGSGWRNLR